MTYEVKGHLYKVYKEEVVPTSNGDLHKHRFVLEIERKNSVTNEVYEPTYPEFELVGNACKYWHYKEGQYVRVIFEPQGNKYKSKDGVEKFYTKLIARLIEGDNEQATENAPVQTQNGSFDNLQQAQDAIPF